MAFAIIDKAEGLPSWIIAVLVVWFGATLGSFLNVVIYRLPRGLSVNKPRRSFCPSCNKQIPYYLNIPLVSWVMLRGKCKYCGSGIAFRYFFVELFTASLFLAIYFTQPIGVAACYWLLICLLVSGTFIDFEHYIIPHEITIGGTFAGLLASFIVPQLHGVEGHFQGLLFSFLSACLGLGLLWMVVELGKLAFGRTKMTSTSPEPWSITQPDEHEPPIFRLSGEDTPWWDIFTRKSDRMIMECTEIHLNGEKRGAGKVTVYQDRVEYEGGTISLEELESAKGTTTQVVIPREAMGFGDVLFLMMIGSFLGWKCVLFTVLAASILGSVCALLPRLIGKTEWSNRIPFGPYLAAAAGIWIFWGPRMLDWYLSILRPMG